MKVDGAEIPGEIVSLQKRADQLALVSADEGRRISSLRVEADGARSLADPALAERLDRKILHLRQRQNRTLHEIETLRALITARRARFGLPAAPKATY